MIPKVIHYCWFGNAEKPKKVQKCIASWRKFCPDFEIVEWNEQNFDVNMNGYTKMCYDEKKYAFLSDYARLYIVEKHGGIYFDTDVELIKPIDFLLNNEAYIGFETPDYAQTGLGFGSVAHGKAVRAMLDEYDMLLDGNHGVITCPKLNTDALLKLGLRLGGELQNIDGTLVLPADYLNPYGSTTGIMNKTENTVSIHWYSGSWMSKGQHIRSFFSKPFHRVIRKLK